MEELMLTKIGALFVMLMLAFLAGLLPIKVRKLLMSSTVVPEKYTLIFLSCSLCCGAGVLMATVFLHILKETRESFGNAMEKGIIAETEYAVPELLMCAGFFLIYFLEELVHVWVHRNHDSKCDHTNEDHEHNQFRRVSSVRLRSSLRRCNSLETPKCCEGKTSPPHGDLHEYMRSNEGGCSKSNTRISNSNNNLIVSSAVKEKEETVAIPMESSINSEDSTAKDESILRTILVILALSLHGTFEGLSLGLEGNAQDVWLLCAALSSHKIFIAFSIGMELLEEGINLSLFLFHMAVFSFASPIGGIIGMTLTASMGNNPAGIMAITILQGVSGGTILYVTFCEVLERERTKASGRIVRLFAMIIGFSIMAGLESGSQDHHHMESGVLNATARLIFDEHHH